MKNIMSIFSLALLMTGMVKLMAGTVSTNTICLSATDPYAREPYSYTDTNGATVENVNNGEITINNPSEHLWGFPIPLTRLGIVNNTPPAPASDYRYEISFYYDGTTNITRVTVGTGDINSITFQTWEGYAKINIIPINNGLCDQIRNVSYAFTWPQPILDWTDPTYPIYQEYLWHCTNVATVYIKDAPENFSVAAVQPTAVEGRATTCDQNDPNVILFKITKDCDVTNAITLPSDPDDGPGTSADLVPYWLTGTAVPGVDYPYPTSNPGVSPSPTGWAQFNGNAAYVVICPINDCMTEGPETVVLSIPSADTVLPVGAPPFSATGTIYDAPNLPPSISLASPATGTVFAAPASITISANASDDCGLAQVDFYNGSNLLASVTSSPYSYTWVGVPPGTYSITGVATDNTGLETTSSTVSVRVDALPTVSITSPINTQRYLPPANIAIKATAADSDGTVTQVDFYAGGVFLGTTTNSPYSYSWNNVGVGTYSITARATDNDGFASISAPVVVFVSTNTYTTNYCTPPPTNIVAWWPAETNTVDIVNGNDGVIEGGVGYWPGEVGEAFLFTNIEAGIQVPASATLNVGTNDGLTLEAWINPTDVASFHPIFEWNTGDDSTWWGVHFYIGAGGSLYGNLVSADGPWMPFYSPDNLITTNGFQHVALTYDKATGVATMYCNGVAVFQDSVGSFTPQTSFNLYIGKRPVTNGETYSFFGEIDEPSIYSRALTASEIQAIYNAGSYGKCHQNN